MVKTSPAQIEVSRLNQIGIVVENLEIAMENYWNILGIGPWTAYAQKSPYAYDTTYHGKPCKCTYNRIAGAQIGPVELELMESVEGPSTYGDFLEEHGEGAHHLQYLLKSVEEIDRHVEIMAKKGFPSVGGGRFGNNGGWNYIDTTSGLGTIWEAVTVPDKFDAPRLTYPTHKSSISPAKIKLRSIAQIGLVVKDLDEAMKNYWELLGIGPGEYCHLGPPELYDLKYYGKPVNYMARGAFVTLGSVQLKLLQSISGDNIYRDFMAGHVQGIHHLQFLVDSIDETNRIMESEGFPVIMCGRLGDGGFAYYDTTGPLKIILEALQVPSPETWLPPT